MGRAFTLVGSRHRAHLHLLSSTVSKAHAIIVNEFGHIYIRDTASREHVFVNDRLQKEIELHDGDLIRIGSFNFKLQHPRPGSTPPRRPPAAVVAVDGTSLPVHFEGRTLVIGRRPGCDLVLSESSVSNVHAIIFELNGRHCIRDLGSRTGTYVNGEQVHNHQLKFGDQLRVGDHEMYFGPAEAGAEMPADELDFHESDTGAELPPPPAFEPVAEEDELSVAPLEVSGAVSVDTSEPVEAEIVGPPIEQALTAPGDVLPIETAPTVEEPVAEEFGELEFDEHPPIEHGSTEAVDAEPFDLAAPEAVEPTPEAPADEWQLPPVELEAELPPVPAETEAELPLAPVEPEAMKPAPSFGPDDDLDAPDLPLDDSLDLALPFLEHEEPAAPEPITDATESLTTLPIDLAPAEKAHEPAEHGAMAAEAEVIAPEAPAFEPPADVAEPIALESGEPDFGSISATHSESAGFEEPTLDSAPPIDPIDFPEWKSPIVSKPAPAPESEADDQLIEPGHAPTSEAASLEMMDLSTWLASKPVAPAVEVEEAAGSVTAGLAAVAGAATFANLFAPEHEAVSEVQAPLDAPPFEQHDVIENLPPIDDAATAAELPVAEPPVLPDNAHTPVEEHAQPGEVAVAPAAAESEEVILPGVSHDFVFDAAPGELADEPAASFDADSAGAALPVDAAEPISVESATAPDFEPAPELHIESTSPAAAAPPTDEWLPPAFPLGLPPVSAQGALGLPPLTPTGVMANPLRSAPETMGPVQDETLDADAEGLEPAPPEHSTEIIAPAEPTPAYADEFEAEVVTTWAPAPIPDEVPPTHVSDETFHDALHNLAGSEAGPLIEQIDEHSASSSDNGQVAETVEPPMLRIAGGDDSFGDAAPAGPAADAVAEESPSMRIADYSEQDFDIAEAGQADELSVADQAGQDVPAAIAPSDDAEQISLFPEVAAELPAEPLEAAVEPAKEIAHGESSPGLFETLSEPAIELAAAETTTIDATATDTIDRPVEAPELPTVEEPSAEVVGTAPVDAIGDTQPEAPVETIAIDHIADVGESSTFDDAASNAAVESTELASELPASADVSLAPAPEESPVQTAELTDELGLEWEDAEPAPAEALIDREGFFPEASGDEDLEQALAFLDVETPSEPEPAATQADADGAGPSLGIVTAGAAALAEGAVVSAATDAAAITATEELVAPAATPTAEVGEAIPEEIDYGLNFDEDDEPGFEETFAPLAMAEVAAEPQATAEHVTLPTDEIVGIVHSGVALPPEAAESISLASDVATEAEPSGQDNFAFNLSPEVEPIEHDLSGGSELHEVPAEQLSAPDEIVGDETVASVEPMEIDSLAPGEMAIEVEEGPSEHVAEAPAPASLQEIVEQPLEAAVPVEPPPAELFDTGFTAPADISVDELDLAAAAPAEISPADEAPPSLDLGFTAPAELRIDEPLALEEEPAAEIQRPVDHAQTSDEEFLTAPGTSIEEVVEPLPASIEEEVVPSATDVHIVPPTIHEAPPPADVEFAPLFEADHEPAIEQSAAPAAPSAPVQNLAPAVPPPAPPRADPMLGMSRDFGSFLGGMPLPLATGSTAGGAAGAAAAAAIASASSVVSAPVKMVTAAPPVSQIHPPDSPPAPPAAPRRPRSIFGETPVEVMLNKQAAVAAPVPLLKSVPIAEGLTGTPVALHGAPAPVAEKVSADVAPTPPAAPAPEAPVPIAQYESPAPAAPSNDHVQPPALEHEPEYDDIELQVPPVVAEQTHSAPAAVEPEPEAIELTESEPSAPEALHIETEVEAEPVAEAPPAPPPAPIKPEANEAEALFDSSPEALDSLPDLLEPIEDITEAVGEAPAPPLPPAPVADRPSAKPADRNGASPVNAAPPPRARRVAPPPAARQPPRRLPPNYVPPSGLTGMGAAPANGDAVIDVFSQGLVDAQNAPQAPNLPGAGLGGGGFIPPTVARRPAAPRPRRPAEPAPRPRQEPPRKPAVIESIEAPSTPTDESEATANDAGAASKDEKAKKKKKWKFPFLGMMAVAVAGGAGATAAWYGITDDVQASLQFDGVTGMPATALADFVNERRAKISTDDFRRRAQAIFENELHGISGDGFLYRGGGDDLAYAALIERLHMDGDRLVFERPGSHDRVGDSLRMSALVKALYVADLQSASAAKKAAEFDADKAALASFEPRMNQLRKQLEDGKKRQADLQIARLHEKELADRAGVLEKRWNDASVAARLASSRLDALKPGPAPSPADDPQIKELQSRLKQYTDALTMAGGSTELSAATPVDQALAQFGRQVEATRAAGNAAAFIEPYLAVATQARGVIEQAADDLADRRHASRQTVSDLKQTLADKIDSHLRAMYADDALLLKFEQDRAVQEHRLGAATSAGLSDESDKISQTVADLRAAIAARRQAMAAADPSTDEIRNIKKLIDDQVHQMDGDTARTEQRVNEQFELLAASAPKADSLPPDQIALLGELNQKLQIVKHAYSAFVESAPSADVPSLKAQIAQTKSSIDARQQELLNAASVKPDPEAMASQKVEVENARRAEAAALADWTAGKKQWADSQAVLDGLQLSQSDFLRDMQEFNDLQSRQNQANEKAQSRVHQIIPMPVEPAATDVIQSTHRAPVRTSLIWAIVFMAAGSISWLVRQSRRDPAAVADDYSYLPEAPEMPAPASAPLPTV